MADVKFEAVRVALSTGIVGTTQEITIEGFGPVKAAIFIRTGGETEDTVRGGLYSGYGFTDGETSVAMGVYTANGLDLSNAARAQSTSAVVYSPTPDGTGVAHAFDFDSFVGNGLRIIVTDQLSVALFCTVILIGGTDVSGASVNSFQLPTGAGTANITNVGFEPDVVFMTCTGNATAPPHEGAHNLMSFGIGINDGPGTCRSVISGVGDTLHGDAHSLLMGSGKIVGQTHLGTLNWSASIVDFDSSGFSLTSVGSPNADYVFYLSLQFANSPSFKLFHTTIPTTGDFVTTYPGFEPTFALVTSSSAIDTYNTVSSASGIFSTGHMIRDKNGIISVSSSDNATQQAGLSSAYSHTSMTPKMLSFDGTTRVEGDSWEFTSSGWDMGLTTNPPSDTIGFGFVIAGSVEPYQAGVPAEEPYSQAGDATFANGDSATFANGDVAVFGGATEAHADITTRLITNFTPSLLAPQKKPTGVIEIDWTHPLTRGLISAQIAINRRQSLDLVSGKITDSSSASLGDPDGIYQNSDGSLGTITVNMGQGSIATHARMEAPATTGGTYRSLVSYLGSGEQLTLRWNSYTSGKRWEFFHRANYGDTNARVSYQVSNDREAQALNKLVVTWDADQGLSLAAGNLYSYSTATTGVVNSNRTMTWLSSGWVGTFYAVWTYNRPLSKAESLALRDNFYQFIKGEQKITMAITQPTPDDKVWLL